MREDAQRVSSKIGGPPFSIVSLPFPRLVLFVCGSFSSLGVCARPLFYAISLNSGLRELFLPVGSFAVPHFSFSFFVFVAKGLPPLFSVGR